MKKLIIMQGLPGSGKSSHVRQVYPSAQVCSADAFFMFDGEYLFNPAKLREAHQACLVSFLDLTQYGEELVVVDNTNLSLWEMAPYVQVGAVRGYAVEVIRVNAPEKLCASRNIHKVSERTVLNMARRMERPLPSWPCSFREIGGFDPLDLSVEEIEDHAFCGMTREAWEEHNS